MSDNVKDFEQSKGKMADTGAEAGRKVGEQLDKAREKFTDAAGEVEEKVKDLGQGASRTSEQVRMSAEKAGVAAKETYGVAKDKVRYGYEKARKDMDHLVEDVNEYVRDNPSKSILIAAGAGFVLGLLMRGRRD